MKDINTSLLTKYYQIVDDLGIPCYEGEEPDDVKDKIYVVISDVLNTEASTDSSSDTITTIQLTINSWEYKYNNSKILNETADLILQAIKPTSTSVVDLSEFDLQMVTLKLDTDRTERFGELGGKVYISRILIFKQFIFIGGSSTPPPPPSALSYTLNYSTVTVNKNIYTDPITPVTGTGGTSPYTYTLNGSLPDGLNFDTSTGELYGTATELWNDTITITVTDSVSAQVTSSNITLISQGLALGQVFAGGYIAYLDNTGEHGFVINPAPYLNSVRWGPLSFLNITSEAIGDGGANTAILGANSVGLAGANWYFCSIRNEGGYTDWVIPTVDECIEILNSRSLMPMSKQVYGYRWTSSEIDTNTAYYFDFYAGTKIVMVKSSFDPTGVGDLIGLYIRYF
jgi:hypothetical protein